jgi:Domain of unknown function (DUF4395)
MQKLNETLRRRLTSQGFACEAQLVGQMALWLRWTPALSAIWIATGTTARSPTILWSFSLCAAAGAMGWHPFDALFNHGVRHLLDLPHLPANPLPRRFAMALAAVFSAATGLLFYWHLDKAGLAAGVLMALGAITVATTQFCAGSWIWHQLGLGRGSPAS